MTTTMSVQTSDPYEPKNGPPRPAERPVLGDEKRARACTCTTADCHRKLATMLIMHVTGTAAASGPGTWADEEASHQCTEGAAGWRP